MIDSKEMMLAGECIRSAIANGADEARVSLSKSVMDGYTFLNGELDKVTHSADRSIYISLFVDGRYGTFSTNRLERDELETFIARAVSMTRMLGEDRFRRLPDPGRTEKGAKTGKELDLYDESYPESNAVKRLEKARSLSIFKTEDHNEGYRLISEECEYSESLDDNYLVDSRGFEGRHTETIYYCFSEMTIEDRNGNKFSGFWWENSPMSKDLPIDEVGRIALERAVSQIGPREKRGGRYKMVVDRNTASRLVSPLLTALMSRYKGA